MSAIYFFDLVDGQDFDLNPAGLTCANLEATFADTLAVSDFFKDGTDAFVTKVAAGANSVGADVSKFQGWSWASAAGALDEF